MIDEAYLPLVIEECGEVLQAIGKVQRFGANHIWPGKGHINVVELALEVGDLLEVIDRLGLDPNTVKVGRLRKTERLEYYALEVWKELAKGGEGKEE